MTKRRKRHSLCFRKWSEWSRRVKIRLKLVFPAFFQVRLLECDTCTNRRTSWVDEDIPQSFCVSSIELLKVGKSVRELSTELGISEQTLYTWRHQSRIDEGQGAGLTSGERAELVIGRKIEVSRCTVVRLMRQFYSNGPDRLWLTDITEHRTMEGRVYYAAVPDVFSRRVVGRVNRQRRHVITGNKRSFHGHRTAATIKRNHHSFRPGITIHLPGIYRAGAQLRPGSLNGNCR